ncbi:myosin-binding protein 1-like isoform X1 [Nymphaea colorata]|nr:myosin-binding protein 1-like isoform X1 [Nymphaea colorata]
MATRKSAITVGEDCRRLTSALVYAATEWLVMFLLFLNALLSYAITKIASFFGLEIPCLLCSRLDHVIGNKTPDFYRELICHAHKLEISSLAYCQIHMKLSDVHRMCEECLVSFATEKKTNPETYRLLVGKLGTDFECVAGDDHSFHLDKQLHIRSNHETDIHVKKPPDDTSRQAPESDLNDMKCCICCGVPIVSNLKSTRLFNASLIVNKAGMLEGSSSCSITCEHHDFLNKKIARSSGSSQTFSIGKRSQDPLDHIGYSELKITSDSESEVPLSDEDDAHSAIQRTFAYNKDPISSSLEKPDSIKANLAAAVATGRLSLHKLDSPSMTSVPSVVVSDEQPRCMTCGHSLTNGFPAVAAGDTDKKQENVTELYQSGNGSTSAPSRTSGYGLEELNWQTSEPLHPAVMEFFTPRAVPSLNKPTKRFTESTFPSLLENVTQIASDKTVKESSETARPMLDIFFTPRAVPSSRKSLEGLSGSLFSSARPEFFTPRAFPSSNKGAEFLSGTTFPSTVPEFFTPRAASSSVPSSVKVDDHVSGGACSSSISKSSTLSTAASSEKPTESLAEVFTSKCDAEAAVTDNYQSEMPSDSASELLGMTRPEGLSRLKLLRPSSLTTDDPSLLMSGSLDLNDAYKLAVGSKGGNPSESLVDNGGKEPSKVPEDLKSLISQISSLRGMSDIAMSPKIQLGSGDLKVPDASTPISLQALHKKLSIERYESGVDSLDGSIVSEIEGESAVDRLKRQVEYDRKAMYALYKELEEERNAAAISANQAMAMITRLQEEKASLHMEALQYLRLMEEQSEYDQEALQKASELLAEREKEIQDLEMELESFRKRFQDEPMLDQKSENATCPDKMVGGLPLWQHDNVENFEGRKFSYDQALNHKNLSLQNLEKDLGKIVNDMNGREKNIEKEYLLDLEDERGYISSCLKKLEKRLTQTDVRATEQGEVAQRCNIKTEEDFPIPDRFSERGTSEGSHGTNGFTVSDHSLVNCDPSLENYRGNYLSTIENEILHLNERLVALEADKDFLEHTLNSLSSGSEGLKLVQEIAHHLREMRRVWSGAAGTCCS